MLTLQRWRGYPPYGWAAPSQVTAIASNADGDRLSRFERIGSVVPSAPYRGVPPGWGRKMRGCVIPSTRLTEQRAALTWGIGCRIGEFLPNQMGSGMIAYGPTTGVVWKSMTSARVRQSCCLPQTSSVAQSITASADRSNFSPATQKFVIGLMSMKPP